MGDLVITEIIAPIATITLNRAKRHNSLVPELLEDLGHSLSVIAAEPDVRAVILQANGHSFSTGGDLQGFYEHINTIEEYANALVGKLNEIILIMHSFPLPIIAAVHGLVTGGSLGFLLAADIVLVAPEVRIIPYYSIVGFSPDGGWTALLPQIIGLKRAAAVLMLNRAISSQDALDWGLASKIVAREDIKGEARELAHKIADGSEGSIVKTKSQINSQYGDLANKLEDERKRFVEQISKPETLRSMADFLEAM